MKGDKPSKFRIFFVCMALVLLTFSCVHLYSGNLWKVPRMQGFHFQDVVHVVLPQGIDYSNQSDIIGLDDRLLAENANIANQIADQRISDNGTYFTPEDNKGQLKSEAQIEAGVNGTGFIGNQSDKSETHLQNDTKNNESLLLKQEKLVQKQFAEKQLKEILIINATEGFHQFKSFVGAIGPRKCPNLNETMTCRFQYGNEKLWYSADVAIFRAFLIRKEEDYWKKRPPGQLWLFDEHESPHKTWSEKRYHDIHIWKDFNLTAVYTPDADVQHYMYAFNCKADDRKPVVKKNHLKGKKKSVLWMVSNCKWTMGRELYVEELKKYIDVDVVGECGDRVECGSYGELKFQCVDKLISRYKFYLAFENSFCEGYYTEKVRKTLHVDTVPVVMGSVNYTDLLAPGAFIDVRDFKSPRELAKYLDKVGHNPHMYNKYINTKNSLECEDTYSRTYLCELCQHLHEHRGERRVYKDMRDFWGMSRRCQSADVYFKDIAPEIVPRLGKHLIFNSTFHPR